MCRGYFYSQEIDPHHATEHRSTDQSRNGCGMCCFCHAQPFEITGAKNIKNPLVQRSCQNAEVVEAFCSRRVHHRDRHQHTIPIALAALPGVPHSRDFVRWRFSDAGRRSAWIASSCRRPKTCTKAEALDWTIILPLSQLGGLHGAQRSRSPDLKRIMEDQVTTAEFAK